MVEKERDMGASLQDRAVVASDQAASRLAPPGFHPSRWEYRPDQYDDWGIVRAAPDAEGRRWIICQARHPYADEEECNEHRRNKTDPWEATARLIAAAPELLEALKDCTDRFTEAFPAAETFPPIIRARAAIAKAQGMSAGTAKTAQPVEGEARQPGPKDAPEGAQP